MFWVVLQVPNGHCETVAGPSIEKFDTEEAAREKARAVSLTRKCPIVVCQAVCSISAEVEVKVQEFLA